MLLQLFHIHVRCATITIRILNWINDEFSSAQWCANKFSYHLSKEQLNEYYHKYEKDENAWNMTSLNEKGIPVGHFLMRNLRLLRFPLNVLQKHFGECIMMNCMNY